MRSPVSKRPLRSIRVTPWRTPAWRRRPPQMRIRFAPEPELQGWVDRAQKEAAAALALDPNLAEAHEARAAVARNLEFDWDLAINESDRALALNPSLEQPHFFRAAAFYHLGLFDRAREEIRLGTENNPVSRYEPMRLLGTTALFGGQFAEAESALRSAQRLTISQVTEHVSGAGALQPGEEDRGRRDLLRRPHQQRAGAKTRAGHAGKLLRRQKRTRESAGAHRRRARRLIHGSPRRLQPRHGARATRRSCRGATLAHPCGNRRVPLLPVVRPRSADATAQIRSGFSGIHEAIEQAVRRESRPLRRLKARPWITSPRGPRSRRSFCRTVTLDIERMPLEQQVHRAERQIEVVQPQ